jgi:hypothetical protein
MNTMDITFQNAIWYQDKVNQLAHALAAPLRAMQSDQDTSEDVAAILKALEAADNAVRESHLSAPYIWQSLDGPRYLSHKRLTKVRYTGEFRPKRMIWDAPAVVLGTGTNQDTPYIISIAAADAHDLDKDLTISCEPHQIDDPAPTVASVAVNAMVKSLAEHLAAKEAPYTMQRLAAEVCDITVMTDAVRDMLNDGVTDPTVIAVNVRDIIIENAQ